MVQRLSQNATSPCSHLHPHDVLQGHSRTMEQAEQRVALVASQPVDLVGEERIHEEAARPVSGCVRTTGCDVAVIAVRPAASPPVWSRPAK